MAFKAGQINQGVIFLNIFLGGANRAHWRDLTGAMAPLKSERLYCWMNQGLTARKTDGTIALL
jgi:hypothetical protein